MIEPYSVFLHLEVTEALRSLPGSERDRVLEFVHALALDPSVVYYTDNADREVRILEVRRADS